MTASVSTSIAPQHRTIDGLKIRFAETGVDSEKPTVLLTSPWPESLYAFAPMWATLATRARLFAIDLPRFGASERREDLLSPRAMGAFLTKLIAEADLGRPHMVCPDVGTSAALFAAAAHPERIASIIVGTGGAAVPLELGEPLRSWVLDADIDKYRRIDPHVIIETAVGTIAGGVADASRADLQGLLPMPPYGSTDEECEEYEKLFNRLARFALQRHAGPDNEGATRWKCPYEAGRVRSRSVKGSMRHSRTAPLVNLPTGVACCGGIVTVQAGELPYWQRFFPGTTAWRISYRRRDVVEGVNAALKGAFVNIGQKFFKVFGLVKIKILLAFTLAAYNLETIRSFLSRMAVDTEAARKPRTRKKRREMTWRDVVAIRPETGPDPPPG
jgi:pimeloyl-ACP methyl ester carboxylesterase